MKKFRERSLLKLSMKIWKDDAFTKGKQRYKQQMEGEVDQRCSQEASEKRLKIQALEEAVKELQEQKVIEIKAKNALKHKLDQIYLRGATNVEMNALKESQQTLNCKHFVLRVQLFIP